MASRMGRPTDNPKTHNTMARLSDKDVEMLEYCSKSLGKSKADVIREGIKKVYEELKQKEK